MKIGELEKEVKKLSKSVGLEEQAQRGLQQEHSGVAQDIVKALAEERLREFFSEDGGLMKEKKEEMIDKLKAMSDDEKLVLGRFAYNAGMMRGCNDFAFYKNPTTCGACHEGEWNVKRLGLEKYVQFKGDRCYSIPNSVFDGALKRLGGAAKEKKARLEEDIRASKDRLKGLKGALEDKKGLAGILKLLEKGGSDYGKVQELMPDFIQLVKNSKGDRISLSYAAAKPEEGVGVILTSEWAYYGSGGSEYGVSVIVFRDGEVEREYYKWRDPHSADNDRPWLAFEEAEILDVGDDGFDVKLKSKESERVKHYSLKKKEPEAALDDRLSEEEQKAFKRMLEEKEEELVDIHYRKDGMMPKYVDLWGFQGVVESGLDTGVMVPYEKPQVIDRFVDPAQGEAVVVIKAQIDAGAGRGKQYEWVAYRIRPEGSEMISRECAYQLDLKDGKRIDMKASEIYRKAQDKPAVAEHGQQGKRKVSVVEYLQQMGIKLKDDCVFVEISEKDLNKK